MFHSQADEFFVEFRTCYMITKVMRQIETQPTILFALNVLNRIHINFLRIDGKDISI